MHPHPAADLAGPERGQRGDPRPPRAARVVLLAALAAALAALAAGAVLLWPAQRTFRVPTQFRTETVPVVRVPGTVVGAGQGPCGQQGGSPSTDNAPQYLCTRVTVRLTGGPDRGTTAVLPISPGPGQPVLHPGDRIRLARAVSGVDGRVVYYFDDFQRGHALLLVGLLFAAAVVAVARWRGLAALAGLGVAFAVLIGFVLPALLGGRDPLAVALVAGGTIMVVVLYLAHGLSWRTTTALVGTLSTLGLVGVLGTLARGGTHLTGLGSEENTAVQSYTSHLGIGGLIVAGLVIGSLGVLNDVTVTQASAVYELHRADPRMPRRALFGSAMRIGRDHIASTVYTLVLAYAGAALPVLILFTVAGRRLGDVLTSDTVATEVVRSAVGGVGLVLAVPLTTALATWATRPQRAARGPSSPLPDGR